MFKLVVKKDEHKIVKERLKLYETPIYNYVITDDKDSVEDDKVNIVFNYAEITRVNRLLDMIVKGEEVYIVGHNQYGQKSVECRNILYFIIEEDIVFAVLYDTRMIIKMKLYEIETLLADKDFVRISKYCLINVGKVDYIKVALNSKLDLEMKNGDHCEVNRSYLKAFKKALKI
jgi:DNA-binding LytR/AlgR family response regulator